MCQVEKEKKYRLTKQIEKYFVETLTCKKCLLYTD